MKVLIGLWLICEAMITLICWIEDEPKVAIPLSAFFTMLCIGAYLVTP